MVINPSFWTRLTTGLTQPDFFFSSAFFGFGQSHLAEAVLTPSVWIWVSGVLLELAVLEDVDNLLKGCTRCAEASRVVESLGRDNSVLNNLSVCVLRRFSHVDLVPVRMRSAGRVLVRTLRDVALGLFVTETP